jgi:hypothetical protein
VGGKSIQLFKNTKQNSYVSKVTLEKRLLNCKFSFGIPEIAYVHCEKCAKIAQDFRGFGNS